MERFITKSDKETEKIASKIIEKYLNRKDKTVVIFLLGELGAGKTIFVKGLAKRLGIKEEIESPTFIFVREYPSEIPLYHFDLYRINDSNELDELGFFDYIERNGIIAIEWAEKVKDLIKPNITVRMDKLSENERQITIEEHTK